MKKYIIPFLIIITIIFSTVSCSNTETKNGSDNLNLKTSTINTDSLPLKDPAGNDIKIPENINKIISLAPSITETLVDLGLGDKIIAIDKNVSSKAGLKKDLPIFDMMSPDIEKMLSLQPDIVFVSGISDLDGKKDPFKSLKNAGICVASIPTENSITEIKSDIMFLANSTKTTKRGNEILTNMQKEIDTISKIPKSEDSKKTIYFEIAAAPNMYSFGTGVFLNEIIELVGGKNIFADQKSWISVTNEVIIQKNPDIIITNVNYIKDPVKEIKTRKGWENINAIKNNNVYYVDNNASSLPNENIVKAMGEIAKILHPEKN